MQPNNSQPNIPSAPIAPPSVSPSASPSAPLKNIADIHTKQVASNLANVIGTHHGLGDSQKADVASAIADWMKTSPWSTATAGAADWFFHLFLPSGTGVSSFPSPASPASDSSPSAPASDGSDSGDVSPIIKASYPLGSEPSSPSSNGFDYSNSPSSPISPSDPSTTSPTIDRLRKIRSMQIKEF